MQSDCEPVLADFWAPTGSVKGLKCPTSGFYCPGRLFDLVSIPAGSLPILIDVGSVVENWFENVTTHTRAVMGMTASFASNQDLMNVDIQSVKLLLARAYDLQPETLLVTAMPGSALLGMAMLQVTIAVGTTENSLAHHELMALLESVNIENELSEALGFDVTLRDYWKTAHVSNSGLTTVKRKRQRDCAKGCWCSAGVEIPWYTSLSPRHIHTPDLLACLSPSA